MFHQSTFFARKSRVIHFQVSTKNCLFPSLRILDFIIGLDQLRFSQGITKIKVQRKTAPSKYISNLGNSQSNFYHNKPQSVLVLKIIVLMSDSKKTQFLNYKHFYHVTYILTTVFFITTDSIQKFIQYAKIFIHGTPCYFFMIIFFQIVLRV